MHTFTSSFKPVSVCCLTLNINQTSQSTDFITGANRRQCWDAHPTVRASPGNVPRVPSPSTPAAPSLPGWELAADTSVPTQPRVQAITWYFPAPLPASCPIPKGHCRYPQVSLKQRYPLFLVTASLLLSPPSSSAAMHRQLELKTSCFPGYGNDLT